MLTTEDLVFMLLNEETKEIVENAQREGAKAGKPELNENIDRVLRRLGVEGMHA